MNWLRPILILLSVVFIGTIIWWERRRPGRKSSFAERSEPSFDSETEQPLVAPLGTGVAHDRMGSNEREVRRAPPVIDWSDVATPMTPTMPTLPSTPIVLVTPESANQPAAHGAPSVGSGASIRPVEVPPELPPLMVEWPAESARRIVTMRIVPARQDRIAGRALRQGLAACGFRHGEYSIFHLPEADGRVVLSVASLVRPGVLDPATMDFQRFSGVNVFAVLPGPLTPELALVRLSEVALELADRVEGRVQDESGAALAAADFGVWRQRSLTALMERKD